MGSVIVIVVWNNNDSTERNISILKNEINILFTLREFVSLNEFIPTEILFNLGRYNIVVKPLKYLLKIKLKFYRKSLLLLRRIQI